MNWQSAYNAMKNHKKITKPYWTGYWCIENNTIMLYCKDGNILDIRKTEDVIFTFDNIASDDWIIYEEKVKDVEAECDNVICSYQNNDFYDCSKDELKECDLCHKKYNELYNILLYGTQDVYSLEVCNKCYQTCCNDYYSPEMVDDIIKDSRKQKNDTCSKEKDKESFSFNNKYLSDIINKFNVEIFSKLTLKGGECVITKDGFYKIFNEIYKMSHRCNLPHTYFKETYKALITNLPSNQCAYTGRIIEGFETDEFEIKNDFTLYNVMYYCFRNFKLAHPKIEIKVLGESNLSFRLVKYQYK